MWLGVRETIERPVVCFGIQGNAVDSELRVLVAVVTRGQWFSFIQCLIFSLLHC